MQLSQLCHCILKYKVHAQTEQCRSTSEFILSTILGLHSYVPNFLFCHDLFYFSSNKCQEKIMWENSQERKVKLLILSFYTGHLCFSLYLHLLKAKSFRFAYSFVPLFSTCWYIHEFCFCQSCCPRGGHFDIFPKKFCQNAHLYPLPIVTISLSQT